MLLLCIKLKNKLVIKKIIDLNVYDFFDDRFFPLTKKHRNITIKLENKKINN